MVDRIRRQIQAEEESLKVAHGTLCGSPPKVPGYDAKKPWNLAYQRGTNMEAYWREEVIEPAMMVLTKVSGLGEVLEGDARVRPQSSPSASAREPSASAPARLIQHQAAAPKLRPRSTNRTGRHHSVQDGKYTGNRTGYPICSSYNEGRCETTAPGGWCPSTWDTVHQCSRCLGQHPAARCPHESMPQPNFLRNQKGKGGEQRDGSRLVQAAQNTVNAELGTSSAVGRVLYLYSGPSRDADGFSTFCKANSLDCDYVDKEFDAGHDLLDQQVWDELSSTLSGYDGCLMSPPCSTFTAARNEQDGGPGPLRTAAGVERYGRNDATPPEKVRVRQGTLLALRSRDTAAVAQKAGKPWVLEQPHWREGKTSMFTLDEFQELLENDDVKIYTLAQCRFGAMAEKLTDLMSNRDLSDLELRCNHPQQWAFAAYPEGLNKALSSKFSEWVRSDAIKRPSSVQKSQIKDAATSAEGHVALNTRFEMSSRLRPRQPAPEPPADQWSLRNVHNSMTGRAKLIVMQIGNLIERELDSAPHIEQAIVANFGMPHEEVSHPTQWLDDLRLKLADLLQRNRSDDMPTECDVAQIDKDRYQTVVRGKPLEYWALVAHDPAAFAAKWLCEGAPAGLSMGIELGDICAEVQDDAPELDEVALATDYDTFSNYEGVETNEDAVAAIRSYRGRGVPS
eukprot:s206_g8.t1